MEPQGRITPSQFYRKDRKERQDHRKKHRIVDPSHHRFWDTDSTDDKDGTDLFSASSREPLNPTESPTRPDALAVLKHEGHKEPQRSHEEPQFEPGRLLSKKHHEPCDESISHLVSCCDCVVESASICAIRGFSVQWAMALRLYTSASLR
jgi:hypothetical protein